MNWTGERLQTFIYNRDAIEHLHRYAITTPYVVNKDVLDIACGEGYGSNLISKYANQVYGVDIDSTTIDLAEKKYKKDNLLFKTGSTDAIPLKENSIDVVISFETIEHHDKHEKMFDEIKRVLKKDGILIISTPDKKYYSDTRNFKNQFHVKELYRFEFLNLISNKFSQYQLLNQEYLGSTSVINEINLNEKSIIYGGNYNNISILKVHPLYMVAICSDYKFDNMKDSIFDGTIICQEELNNHTNKVHKSITFRVGSFFLYPLRLIKRLVK